MQLVLEWSYLRRLLSILLLLAFALPLASPLLALGSSNASEMLLPACCRKGGQHHCMMSAAERREAFHRERGFTAMREKCPCCPAAVMGTLHSDLYAVPVSQAIFASLVSHPAGMAQTESRWRIARDRSRQKRGPPASSISI